MNRMLPTHPGRWGHHLRFPQRMLGESNVMNWHGRIPWGTIRLCARYRFSAKPGVDGCEERFRRDDRRRLWWDGFEDGFEPVDQRPTAYRRRNVM